MKKEGFFKRLKRIFATRLKFILFDEEKFHELFSVRMRPGSLLFSLITMAVLLIAGTVLLIRYTPLKGYLTTDDTPALRRQTAELLYRLDSLTMRQDINEAFILAMRDVVAGNVQVETFKDSTYVDSISRMARERIYASAEDTAFRQEMETRQMEALKNSTASVRNILSLSSPMKGTIVSSPYDYTTERHWIGLAAGHNMPVFAVLAGTVLYKDWTPASGNVLIIQHGDGITTVYKNLGVIPKSMGEQVAQGELIAMTGSEAMSEPTVYFELWINGKSVNPEDYINFGM